MENKKAVGVLIDLSSHNGNVAHTNLSGNTDGVIIRIGYRGYSAGTIKEDSEFKDNLKGVVAAGIPFGFYFMGQAISESEAIAEAKFCHERTKEYEPTYPFFYDSEYSNGNHNGRADGLSKVNRTAITVAFCEEMEELGRVPGVYASKSWFSEKLDISKLKDYHIWVAQYNTSCTYTLSDYSMWQFTSDGKISGVSGRVDKSYVYHEFVKKTSPAVPSSVSEIKLVNGINAYSLSKDGNKVFVIDGKKSNFKVKEFRCKDGSDIILIDSNLVRNLQRIREHFGKSVSITSAFRTVTHNKSVNGATSSYHVKGQAADITVTGATTRSVAEYAQSIGILGIGLYDYTGGFVHVDTRTSKSFWKQDARNVKYYSVTSFIIQTYVITGTTVSTVRYNDSNEYVGLLQKKLKTAGFYKGAIDNKFGPKTEAALRSYQKSKGLAVDAVAGKNTWTSLLK